MTEKEDNDVNKITIVEKNVHRTNLQRIKDTLCLFFPIFMAFAGCFLADPVWKLVTKKETAPELFKFGAAFILFIFTSGIVFIISRKINPIMKIGIFNKSENQ